ncbi:MAG: hypothetical protein P4L20_12805 [Acidimicrobiales bacterium]|nr:hypothetical protein [Acidimicrobiales bacterium]
MTWATAMGVMADLLPGLSGAATTPPLFTLVGDLSTLELGASFSTTGCISASIGPGLSHANRH